MRVLLAVDGSTYTKKMLAYLAAHDMYSEKNEYTAFTAQLALPSQARLSPVIKFLARQGITPQCLWKTGKPGELISKIATDGKYDLVVMGSHGYSALINLVVGSVATEVLAGCKVPVLIVR